MQQYSAAAVLGALLDDLEAAAGLVEAADLVLVTNAAKLPGTGRPGQAAGPGRPPGASWPAGG